MKKIKKDNSGFTLVELLIAMAIIAIVLAPLYSNFRQSTYLNGKAKQAMNATNMASNLMEGLSAYTPEEIILGFYSNDSVSGNIPGRQNTLNIMPNEVVVGEYGDLTRDPSGNFQKGFITSNLMLGAGSYDYSTANYAQPLGGSVPQPSMEYLKIKESPDGKYYFFAEGVEQARGTYDILLELDVTHETGFSGDLNEDGVISGTEVTGINDYEAAQITNVNPLFDGVYTEGISQRQNAAAALLSKKTNPGLNIADAAEMYPGVNRTLTVTIERDPVTDFVTVTVDELYKITGNFSTASGTWIDLNNDFSGQTMEYSTTSRQVFDGSLYKQDPRNIFIYYTGNYYSNTTRYLDNFVVNNDDKVPVNIYFVRNKTAETTSAVENTYASSLTINEPVNGGGVSGFQTDIYSNLRDDLTKKDVENAANRNNFQRCKVTINSSPCNSSNADYEEIVHETGGVKKEIRDRMYGITMYVYDKGAADAGFPDDMKITEFSGSSLQ